MLLERYPNWCANSNDEWEENLDNWNDIEENINFDLNLESFSKGHVGSFHLFGIKSLDDKIKLIFYIKNSLQDFFDFSSLDDSNNFSVIIDFSDYVEFVHKLIFFLNEKGVFINKKQH
ncbi:hypothetical protein AO376_0694 [Moraxella catarrhalis]|nr:hypothetical protein [Moraxella catarrhalis]OAV15192.1 hypothetical protein AO376_0694 [Moraxella catarrhalis]